jgi:hypothetical protein
MTPQEKAVAILDQLIQKENPELDATIRRSLTKIAANMAKRPKKEPEDKEKTAQVIHLPFWEDDKQAAPNALFRSALFPVLSTQEKENRLFLDEEKLCSVAGLDVIFTGKQFDQSDLDIYLELLNLARAFPLGTPITFSAYSLLKALGLSTGGKDHKRLHSVLIRLCGGVLDITDHKKKYFGQLIYGGIRDEVTLNYEITLNPKFAALFGYGMWSTIDKPQRQALKRNPTAKVLHAYYSTHAAPSAHSYDTLATIAGLKNSNKRQTKSTIIKAHEAMKAAGFLEGYEPNLKTIKATIRHTASQIKHLTKKSRKKTK